MMVNVAHLENATDPLSIRDIYQPFLKVDGRDELLTCLCALIAYYMRVEGLSKQEAGNLASQTLKLLVT